MTAKEFLKHLQDTKPNEWKGINNFTVDDWYKAMERYSVHVLMNHVNHVPTTEINTCDTCGCLPSVIYNTPQGRFCVKCLPTMG